MSLAAKDIEKIAHLAKLNLSSTEAAQFTQQLANIIHLVEQMNSVNTDHVTAVCHALEVEQHLRPDQITETNQRTAFQKIAPAVEAGLYLVPKVIETI